MKTTIKLILALAAVSAVVLSGCARHAQQTTTLHTAAYSDGKTTYNR